MTWRTEFLCLDCKVDTSRIGEYYFLSTDVWLKVAKSLRGMYCIGCFEARLGRTLTKEDFTDCYINKKRFGSKSERLLNRLSTIRGGIENAKSKG